MPERLQCCMEYSFTLDRVILAHVFIRVSDYTTRVKLWRSYYCVWQLYWAEKCHEIKKSLSCVIVLLCQVLVLMVLYMNSFWGGWKYSGASMKELYVYLLISIRVFMGSFRGIFTYLVKDTQTSNHWQLECLFNNFVYLISKQPQACVLLVPFEVNPRMIDGFSSQRARNAENLIHSPWNKHSPYHILDIVNQQTTATSQQHLIDRLHKFHSALVPYHTMHHFATEMCTHFC